MCYLPNTAYRSIYVVYMYALFNEQHKEFCKRILIKCNFFLFPNLEPNSCGGPVTLDVITEGALSDLAARLPGQAPDSVS